MIESVIGFVFDDLSAQLDAGEWDEATDIVRVMVYNLPTAKVRGPVDVSRLPEEPADVERILGMPFGSEGWSVIVTNGFDDASAGLVVAARIGAGEETNLLAFPIAFAGGHVGIPYLAHAVWDGTDAFPEIDARDLAGLLRTLPDDLKGEVSDMMWEGAVTALLATAAAFGRTA